MILEHHKPGNYKNKKDVPIAKDHVIYNYQGKSSQKSWINS